MRINSIYREVCAVPKNKKEIEIITSAKPHTIRKFELIDRYVDEWARKILGYNGERGFSGSKGIVYIDCMCNSGIYRDELNKLVDGTAVRVVRKLNEIIQNYPGKKAIIFFNDLESERIIHLEGVLSKFDCSHIEIHTSATDCNVFLKQLDLSAYKYFNTLLLYDPYEATIDWDAVSPFLNRWGEVIINHMVSDTTRGAALAKKSAVIKKYQDTYQQNISDIIEIGKERKKLDELIIKIIKGQIDKKLNTFIASFPFFIKNNVMIYNLIHCCNNIVGHKLYKKVAWNTFGGKSSLKNTHGLENQLQLDVTGSGIIDTATDENCYYVKDIAKYVFEKYNQQGKVDIGTIYNDLDHHPIFPSDGFKNEIKSELKTTYNASFPQGYVVFNSQKGV